MKFNNLLENNMTKKVYINTTYNPEFDNASKILTINSEEYQLICDNEVPDNNEFYVCGDKVYSLYDIYILGGVDSSKVNVLKELELPYYHNTRESKLTNMSRLIRSLNKNNVKFFQALPYYGNVEKRFNSQSYNELIKKLKNRKVVLKETYGARGIRQIVMPADYIYQMEQDYNSYSCAGKEFPVLSDYFNSVPFAVSDYEVESNNELKLDSIFKAMCGTVIACEYLENIINEYRVSYSYDKTQDNNNILFTVSVRDTVTNDYGYTQANQNIFSGSIKLKKKETYISDRPGQYQSILLNMFKDTELRSEKDCVNAIYELIKLIGVPYGSIDIARLDINKEKKNHMSSSLKPVTLFPLVIIETSTQMRMATVPYNLDLVMVDNGIKAMINLALENQNA